MFVLCSTRSLEHCCSHTSHQQCTGTLQSNKAGLLVKGVRNLAMVETVTSIKLATKLNSAVKGAVAEDLRPPGVLSVMIQVNSSGEPQKGGVENAEEAIALANHIATSCPHLQIAGVMTIGNADYTAGVSGHCVNIGVSGSLLNHTRVLHIMKRVGSVQTNCAQPL